MADQAHQEPKRGLEGIDLLMALVANVTPQGYDRFTPDEGAMGLLWHLNYAPTLSLNPAADATADAFDFSSGPASGSLANSGESEWSFNMLTSATLIDRASGGSTRSTLGGTTTFLAGRQLDSETALGFGLELGAATTNGSGPSMTLNSMQIGGDFIVAKRLSPDLFGGLYLGYELGAHEATVSGDTGNFLSHTLKAGAKLQGRIVLDQFTLTPAVSGMLSYRHRNAYVDSASASVPASNFLSLNANGGVTASRDLRSVGEPPRAAQLSVSAPSLTGQGNLLSLAPPWETGHFGPKRQQQRARIHDQF